MERADLENLDTNIQGANYFKLGVLDLRTKEMDITYKILFDIYFIFAEANHELVKAADKNISISEFEDTNSNEFAASFLRKSSLKNAILKYNVIEDYILQIVAFAYGVFFKTKNKEYDLSIIKSKEDYQKKRGKVNYNRVIENLKLKCLKKKIIDYHNESKKLKKYANIIKHNNSLNIRDSFSQNKFKINFSIKTQGDYNPEWIIDEGESIEFYIDYLYDLQPKIKIYIDDVYKQIYKDFNLKYLDSKDIKNEINMQ